MGLMPHPERMSEAAVGGADGRLLFDAARAALAASVGAAAGAERAS
jgi:phosphoribosylformylglycinamidine (FGAM) synthase-like amidotransferase family enzyme